MAMKLTDYIGQYKKNFFFAPVLTVAESSAELLLPLLMGMVVDGGINKQNKGYIIWIGVAMVVISGLGLLCGILSAKYSSRAAQGYGANLRNALFEKIQTFSFADVDRFSTASLVTRTTIDVRQIQEVVLQVVRMLVRAPTLLIMSMLICMRLNMRLSSVYLIAIPLMCVIVMIIMHFTRPLFGLMQKKLDTLNSSIQENMIGIRVVKTFVRAVYEKTKFKRANDDVMNTSIKAGTRISLMMPCSTAVFNFAAIALYWFGGLMVGNETMLSGELLTFVAYLNNIMFSVMMFTMVLTRLSRAQVCIDRCREVLNHQVDVQSGADSRPENKLRIKGKICMENVSFGYPQSENTGKVLQNINLTINPGEFIAIIGRTGCGKTSLINLVPRFYDATQGRVLIDDVDIREYDLIQLRKNIGIVLQNNVLFSGTIRENLMWGAPEATDPELLRAAEDAQAMEFISRFPDGLDTYIEQGGVNVSGGQKQRLCIARALLKNPAILILDDSTSAVDSATETKLRETFRTRYQESTILLVAQKISSVQNADRIVVVENGSIEAVGTHSELLKTNPVYQAIYHSQQEGVVVNG